MLEQTSKRVGGKLFEDMVNYACKQAPDFLPDERELEAFAPVFEDADLVDACFCLFNNDLNVSKTANVLYMHRNTLIYKIARIKRLTGIDVGTFSGALTFIISYKTYLAGGGIKL